MRNRHDGTLMFRFDGKVTHVDPVSRYADYSKLVNLLKDAGGIEVRIRSMK
ncbi:MAG: hypothetical protein ABIK89_01300 [Planctomycetota bacterium]